MGRLELHEKLCEILGSSWVFDDFNFETDQVPTKNSYFNPPEDIRMKYPAIVYHRKPIDNAFANNGVYMQSQGYEVIVIDEDPEGNIARKVSQLPTCKQTRHFTSDNLVHDVFELYY